jgi:integrase
MRAWLFQDSRLCKRLGTKKCPWSVGWLDADGRRRSKKLGAKSTAEKYRKKVEAELALGLCTVGRKRTMWAAFRSRFEETIRATNAPSTVDEYLRSLDAYQRLMHPVNVDSITTADVDRFTAKRKKDRQRGGSSDDKEPKPLTPASVNKDLRALKVALRKAHQWGMLPTAPVFTMLREPERDPYYIDDATFAALYDACGSLGRPAGRHYPAADWWKSLLAFAYMTGWRIGEILALQRADVDLDAGIAVVDADETKGRRTARVELHPIVIDHLRVIVGFGEPVFEWPHHERTLWTDFAALKTAAGVEFPGAFHRLRFGFANVNVDSLPADLLQRLMRHKAAATTRRYINAAERMKRAGTAAKLHVPDALRAVVAG